MHLGAGSSQAWVKNPTRVSASGLGALGLHWRLPDAMVYSAATDRLGSLPKKAEDRPARCPVSFLPPLVAAAGPVQARRAVGVQLVSRPASG